MESYPIKIPCLYALSTLIYLWQGSSSDNQLFWMRIPFAALLLLVLVGFFLWKDQKFSELKSWRVQDFKAGILCGLAFLGAWTFFLNLILHSSLFPQLASSLKTLSHFPTGALLVGALLWATTSEIIYRDYLGPQWGYLSTAFVRALTVGTATQSISLFLWIWALDASLGFLHRQKGIRACILAHSLCFLGSFLLLRLSL